MRRACSPFFLEDEFQFLEDAPKFSAISVERWRPMQHLIEATEQAVRARNWYAALTLALAMPDICGRLVDPRIRSKARYKSWFTNYVQPKYSHAIGTDREVIVFLGASDCYALRCAMLHEGDFDVAGQPAKEVLSRFQFREPPEDGCLHGNLDGEMLQLQVDVFCSDVCDAVRAWLLDVALNSEIQGRMLKLARILPAPW